jgi:hypothetical protein
MYTHRASFRIFTFALTITLLLLTSCSTGAPTQVPQTNPTPTATPTKAPQSQPEPTQAPPPSPCEGLSGEIELQVLVGPADTVGLTPKTAGLIPFSVTSSTPPFTISGSGPINYQETLTENWGTYTVNMEMDTTLNGECSDASGEGKLHANLTLSGSQLVEVRSDGFNQDYPWQGTEVRTMEFPLQEGASAQGEGWVCVLHID